MRPSSPDESAKTGPGAAVCVTARGPADSGFKASGRTVARYVLAYLVSAKVLLAGASERVGFGSTDVRKASTERLRETVANRDEAANDRRDGH